MELNLGSLVVNFRIISYFDMGLYYKLLYLLICFKVSTPLSFSLYDFPFNFPHVIIFLFIFRSSILLLI